MKNSFSGIIRSIIFMTIGVIVIGSCQSPNTDKEVKPIDVKEDIVLSIPNDTTIHMLEGETYSFSCDIKKGEIKILSESPDWKVSVVNEKEKTINVTFPKDAQKSKQFDLIIGSTSSEVTDKMRVHFKVADLTERGGMFILSEGNMTTENGSIAYLTPDGGLIDTLYKRVNGSELGNVAQNMCISNGKAYIISQNGEVNAENKPFNNDGMLVVVDLKTFKKIKSYKKADLSKMEWPTHIVTLDGQNIYIRAKNGIWHLDDNTGELSLVENVTPNKSGTDYLPVNNVNPNINFVVLNNKIYYASYYRDTRSGIIKEITSGEKQAKDKKLPVRMAAVFDKIVDVLPSDDGKLWLLGVQGNGLNYKIMKFDVNKNYGNSDILPYNVLTEEIKTSGNSNNIAILGDRIFFQDPEQTVIYHFKWDENASPMPQKNLSGVIEGWEGTPEADEFIDFFDIDGDARTFYNGFAFNPINKKLYVYTLKSYTQWNKSGKIFELDPDAKSDVSIVTRKWESVGRFPAGFFFNK